MTTNGTNLTLIHIPAPLRSYTGGQATINVKGISVGDALEDLAQQFPDLRHHLYDNEGTLRTFVNIYLNDEDIRYLRHTSTKLSEDDELSIVPSIAGGCPDTLTSADVALSPKELRRYQRHLILPEVGIEGQLKLKAASVLLVGAGAWDRHSRSTWPPQESGVSGSSILMWSMNRICSARCFTASKTWEGPNWRRPATGSAMSTNM